MDIATAVNSLDPSNDDHWTTDGMPRVDVVAGMVGVPVNRKMITDAAPDVTRDRLLADVSGERGEDVEAEVPEFLDGGLQPMDGQSEPPKPRRPRAEFDAGHVDVVDDVVNLTIDEVCRNVALIDRALAEYEQHAVILGQRRDAAIRELQRIGQVCASLNKVRDRIAPRDTSGIKEYLVSQQRVREERAARARRFIDAGVTAQDVARELSGPSPIDAAMRLRRPGRGSVRPAYPMSGAGA